MSLGSILGKIAGVGASFIPGVGPALSGILGAAGSAAGSMANASAQNRDAQFSGQMDLASLLANRDLALQNLRAQADNDYTSNQIAREQSGMATRDDAWKKLLSAQHTLSPSQMPMVSKYQAPQRQATDAEKQGANALTAEVMARLQGGNPIAAVEKRNPAFDYDPMKTIDPRLLKPGTGEKIGGILAPVLTGIGGIFGSQNTGFVGPTMRGNGQSIGPQLSSTDLAFLRTQNPRMVA
jgi:hypothetical protein